MSIITHEQLLELAGLPATARTSTLRKAIKRVGIEVVKRALVLNASAVILAHNHPSGVAEPSEADRSITLKLAKALALALVEVRLLDHLVVGGEHITSLAERGWI